MNPFKNWKIRTKLIAFTLLLALVPLGVGAILSLNRFTEDLKHSYESDLEHIVTNIHAMCRAQQELLQTKLTSDLKAARFILFEHGDSIAVSRNRTVEFTAENQATRERQSVRVPFWSIGGRPITGDNAIVDRVQQLVGGTCTIFQRIDGDRLLRVSTNVLRADGERAVGTYLPASSEVTRTILRGEIYRGRAFVVNAWYITAYEPIRDSRGEVSGALYVGIPEQSALSLKAAVKSLKIGKTGYAYIMDGSGNLILHPAKEGENIEGVKGPAGFEYMREIARRAKELPENQVGTIRYPWANAELGEKTPRIKILKYQYFRDWDWIIAAGSYEEEIFAGVARTKFFITLVALGSIGLAIALAVLFSRILTRPIMELTEVTARMAQGDLSQKVSATRTDEIGTLARSFNRMADQVLSNTRNLEDIVRTRTKELRKTKDFTENIVQSSVDAIVTTDPRGRITFVNRAMEEMVGVPRETILNRHISQFYKEGIEEARRIMAVLREKGSLKNYETQMVRDGRTVPILTSASLLRDETGGIIGTLGVFKDLTEKKKLEEELKKTQAHLVQAGKMRALGELVAGVAHEVNNPLMAADTFLHVMRENLSPDDENWRRVELIRRCHERIAKIVNHLRDFSRQSRLDFQEIDIREPVENALLITAQQLLNHHIRVVKNFEPNLPKVWADTHQLEQVFLNLIANARDSLEETAGGRELAITTGLIRHDGWNDVEVAIRDTGAGIPEENLEKIFEPFFSTKAVGQGTGLGLSLCYGIIEAHGGRIEVESRVGAGTTFRVVLPVLGNHLRTALEWMEG